MDWNKIVSKVTPYIVKIETPATDGTGFLCLYNQRRNFCGIATAAHVISYADEWQQPIRIQHYPTGGTVLLKEENRVIFLDPKNDSAVILIQTGILDFPEDIIPLLPSETALGIGAEVGWLGYPAIESNTLCFFSGTISARTRNNAAYLIDGVAINGVSGGPVVYSTADGVQIVGDVSAYRANRVTGETLPGLLVAQDLSHFHKVISHINSIDEANRKKREAEQEAKAEAAESAASLSPVIAEAEAQPEEAQTAPLTKTRAAKP